MLQNKIDKFVKSVSESDQIAAIALYGSTALGNENPSDIDLLVLTKSDNFYTTREVYDVVAKFTGGIIKPTVKSVKEISPNNFMTMTNRYANHLYNVAQPLYENGVDLRETIDDMWAGLQNNLKTEHAYKIGPAFIIRHRYLELMRGNFIKVLNDDRNKVDRPSKTFFQSALDVIGCDIEKAEELDIVKYFYENVPCDIGSADNVKRIRKRIDSVNDTILNEIGENVDLIKVKIPTPIQEEIKDIYAEFKHIVEEAAWELNMFLIE